MQLIPINDETDKFNMDFYLKSENDFHFAIVDQVQLDEGKLLDFKQSDNGEVSGNVKSRDSGPVSYYIALKSIQDSTDITVSLAHRPLDKSQLTPPPPPQQRRMPPQQPPQQRRMPPQQQQQRGMPPQQQQQRGMPPQQQQQRGMPPQNPQQRRMPPQQQQQRRKLPQQQQQRRKPQQSTPKNTATSHSHTVNSTKNKNTLLLCIVGIVSLSIVGGLIWFFMFRKKEKAKLPGSVKKVRIPYQNPNLRMHKPREYASKMKERLNLSSQNNIKKQTRGENTSLLNKLKSIPTV